MKSRVAVLVLLQLGVVMPALAQNPGSARALFLLIQPSVRESGMATASASSQGVDVLAPAFNPARLGMMSLKHFVSTEFYPKRMPWLPALADDIHYEAKSFLFGYRLNQKSPIALGIGYTRVHIDLGERAVGGEEGSGVLEKFHSCEGAHVFTIGAGFDHLVQVGVGANIKYIESNLASVVSYASQLKPASARTTALDVGINANLPIIEAIAKWRNTSVEIRPGIRPLLTIATGYSQSNIGGKIRYIDADRADPLPRTARIGIGISAGLEVLDNESTWRVVSFEGLHEAEQLLVRDGAGEDVGYARFLGDINLWKNVILGKSGPLVITKRGWELSILEIFSIRNGRHEDPLGKLYYDTEGMGVSLSGVLKLMRLLVPVLKDNRTFGFGAKHLDIQFNTSSYDSRAWSTVAGTKYKSLRISF